MRTNQIIQGARRFSTCFCSYKTPFQKKPAKTNCAFLPFSANPQNTIPGRFPRTFPQVVSICHAQSTLSMLANPTVFAPRSGANRSHSSCCSKRPSTPGWMRAAIW